MLNVQIGVPRSLDFVACAQLHVTVLLMFVRDKKSMAGICTFMDKMSTHKRCSCIFQHILTCHNLDDVAVGEAGSIAAFKRWFFSCDFYNINIHSSDVF